MSKSLRPRNKLGVMSAPAIVESYRAPGHGGINVESLMEMLTTRRPHDSETEWDFSRQWLDSIPGMECDSIGNRWFIIPGPGDYVCFTSHVDTVHRFAGKQAIQKRGDIISLSPNSNSDCLGADDAAGVWLMRELILAGKPGLYIFHRGEECGGIGSHEIARSNPELLNGIDAVISLDRYGYESVITNQCGKTASDLFANSLAAALGIDTLRADNTGLFTDSANYKEIVGECTNLSVGYFGHHTPNESLDVSFLVAIRAALLCLDVDKLEFQRKPWERESQYISGNAANGKNGTKLDLEVMRDLRDRGFDISFESDAESHMRDITGRSLTYADGLRANAPDNFESQFEIDAMARILEQSPELSAEFLLEMGISLEELEDGVHYIRREREKDSEIPF